MARPLLPYKIPQLEKMFAGAITDAEKLKELEHELQQRNAPRAVALLDKVQEALKTGKPGRQEDLPVDADDEQGRPPSTPRKKQGAFDSISLSVDEAHKLLKATPSSTWESIEQTRRRLVQLAHPDRIAMIKLDDRALVQEEARRVNAAYAVLRRLRQAEA